MRCSGGESPRTCPEDCRYLIQLWDCLGNVNQGWRLFTDGTIRGFAVQLWDCLGGANQK